MVIASLFIFVLGANAVLPSEEASLEPQSDSIWQGDIGNGFKADTCLAGFAAGAGFGEQVFGGRLDHHLALGQISAGWIFTDVLGADHWYQGNLELRGELFGGGQFKPDSRYVVGGTGLFRYDLVTHSRWVPFIQIGAGPTGTDIGPPDLSCSFEFNVQCGAGTYFFLRKNLALSAEWRWFHLSDAGLTRPNTGVNTQMFMCGLTWFF